MNVIRSLYGLQDTSSSDVFYDLVVPLEYGVLSGEELLPDATIRCLYEASKIIATGRAENIAWGSTGYFGPGANVVHAKKLEYIEGRTVHPIVSDNSIQEAMGIREKFPQANKILIICDWRHGRRSRLIWKYFFPEAEIHFMSIDGIWNEKHQSMWQRSPIRWLSANILHHLLIRLCGVPRLLNFVHRLTRKSS